MSILLVLLVLLDPAAAPQVSLDELSDLGEFEVTLEGKSLESHPSKKPCVYFEWTYGVLKDGQWQTRWSGYHSEDPITIVTPRGRIELRPTLLRPYLAPSFDHTYSIKEKRSAPEVVAEEITKEGAPMTVREYRLEAGKTYHARIAVETYTLPPEPDSDRPGQGHNTVLWISDLPFKDGKAQHPITPTFEHWSY